MGVGAEKRQCLSPASFSAHRKPAQIRPKPARNPSLGQGCYPPPEGDHAAAHKGKQGGDSRVGACGMIQQAGGSGCARLQRTQLPPASRPRRAAGAFSLVTAWSFLHRYQSGQQLEFSIKTVRRSNVHCKAECILLQYFEKPLEWRRYMICPLSLFAMTSRK